MGRIIESTERGLQSLGSQLDVLKIISNRVLCSVLIASKLSQVCLLYTSSVDESKKARIADTVAQGGQVTINGTTNNLGTAEVYATATTSQGGEVPYQISMVRDGLGWKVSSVSLSFTSQS